MASPEERGTVSCRTPTRAFPTPTEERDNVGTDPVNDALERLEWQEAREDAPERHPLAAISPASGADRRRGGAGEHRDRACGGDGNKPASSKAQSGTPASGIFKSEGSSSSSWSTT
jgi:hypothetical protein